MHYILSVLETFLKNPTYSLATLSTEKESKIRKQQQSNGINNGINNTD